MSNTKDAVIADLNDEAFAVTALNSKWRQVDMQRPSVVKGEVVPCKVSVNAERLSIIHCGGLQYKVDIDGQEVNRVRKLTLVLEAGEQPKCTLEVYA